MKAEMPKWDRWFFIHFETHFAIARIGPPTLHSLPPTSFHPNSLRPRLPLHLWHLPILPLHKLTLHLCNCNCTPKAQLQTPVVTMTTFDVFCLLTVIDMREAELEAARKAKEAAEEVAEKAKAATSTSQVANALFTPGDSAKGAKLFQVS